MQSLMNDVYFSLLQATHNNISMTKMLTILKTFEREVKTITDINDFIINNYETLSTIKFQLNYLLSEPDVRKNNGSLIGFRDRLFGNLLKNISIENENRKVTKVFNEFIKGITYFDGEHLYNPHQPYYHRIASCPQEKNPNMKCKSTNNNSTVKDISKQIEKCYLERLIYDHIWTHIMQSNQNIAHINWLDDTHKSFKTCFPDTDISVEIEYNSNDIPVFLSIQKQSGENEIIETYEKPYDTQDQTYVYLVACYKVENDIVSRKLSSFTHNVDWETAMSGGTNTKRIAKNMRKKFRSVKI